MTPWLLLIRSMVLARRLGYTYNLPIIFACTLAVLGSFVVLGDIAAVNCANRYCAAFFGTTDNGIIAVSDLMLQLRLQLRLQL